MHMCVHACVCKPEVDTRCFDIWFHLSFCNYSSLNPKLTGLARLAARKFQGSSYPHLPSAIIIKLRDHILYPKSGPTSHPKSQRRAESTKWGVSIVVGLEKDWLFSLAN